VIDCLFVGCVSSWC